MVRLFAVPLTLSTVFYDGYYAVKPTIMLHGFTPQLPWSFSVERGFEFMLVPTGYI